METSHNGRPHLLDDMPVYFQGVIETGLLQPREKEYVDKG